MKRTIGRRVNQWGVASRIPAALIALALGASDASAHTGLHYVQSFSTGLMHPLSGLDHVLAMVAVGLYATNLGGAALWRLPAAFVTAMAVGGFAGYGGLPLPHVEHAIGMSVVVLGLTVALGIQMPNAAALTLVALFAVFHGHAHGSEATALTAYLSYAAGFVVATTILHVSGIALGSAIEQCERHVSTAARCAVGGFGALAGVSIMSGWV